MRTTARITTETGIFAHEEARQPLLGVRQTPFTVSGGAWQPRSADPDPTTPINYMFHTRPRDGVALYSWSNRNVSM